VVVVVVPGLPSSPFVVVTLEENDVVVKKCVEYFL
jgi:hypothetical protein